MSKPTLTDLLSAARRGDRQAAGEAFSRIYDELHRLAHAKLRRHQTMTLLDTTSLVHESYLRLIGAQALPVEDRHHFFTYAARVMRSVIVDFARKRQAECRGGDVCIVTLTGTLAERSPAAADEIVRVHEALDQLARLDARLAQGVEMRYFAGLTEPQIAHALGISERTVRRDWEKARLLLARALAG